MSTYLDEILLAQKRGESRGIASICSAHPWVLKTALQGEAPVLIEATCNQVNQFGGYTGLTPAGFVDYVHDLAKVNRFLSERLILGGDHLGPYPWRDQPAEIAMQNAAGLVSAFVQAGFEKIHLDASMRLGDDEPAPALNIELAARRTAILAKAAEVCADVDQARKPRYVIGTEVPVPGGATEAKNGIHVTTPEEARDTIEIMRTAFFREGLETAWERLIALVVQPGVEFGGDFIHDYDPDAARDLSRFGETIPIIFEVHSTDYQPRESLQSLVRDHFAILKVGPALTFAFREAAFALAKVEAELFPPVQCSHLIERLDEAMQREPAHWKDHYRGMELDLALERKYSLSDRIRYYWVKPEVQSALDLLLKNFGGNPLPLSLVSQYCHSEYTPIREGKMKNSARAILTESVSAVLRDYLQACQAVR